MGGLSRFSLAVTAVTVVTAGSYGADHSQFLPNPKLTPGATTSETAKQLCSKSFHTGSVRNVPESEKKRVYAEYNMTVDKKPCPCEVDHLISLEIGGSNDINNLWPQPYNTKPYNAHVKDKLENRLHALVCKGTITLLVAQQAIATDWITAYGKYVGEVP